LHTTHPNDMRRPFLGAQASLPAMSALARKD
jgi:hypothetical protein